jgi:Zn-dependent protease with chaperone function
MKPPGFWIIELKQFRVVNILSVGFQTGFRPFRPALFICRPILSLLSEQELEAVVLNEVSHLALQHLRKRFVLTSFLILATAAIAILTIAIGQKFFPKDWVADVLGPSIAFVSFLASLKYLGVQRKNHEAEGDWYSVEKLGVSPDHLISALRKLDLSTLRAGSKEDIVVPPGLPFLGFPETEQRISVLQDRLKTAISDAPFRSKAVGREENRAA